MGQLRYKKKKNRLSVRKKSGQFEHFDPKKFLNALKRTGCSRDHAVHVLSKVEPHLTEGVSTQKIERITSRYLYKKYRQLGYKYNFKRAILELGPGGYIFEQFVAQCLAKEGYKTTNNVIKKGRCIKHEIDIVACAPENTVYVECKFHNSVSHKNDAKTALYVLGRYFDLKSNDKNKFDEFWIASNSKYSDDALKLGNCMGMTMMGLFSPKSINLSILMVKNKVYPITSLKSLGKNFKLELLKNQIITIDDLEKNMEWLEQLDLSQLHISKIVNEIQEIKKIS
ncbi:MAG: restriction endonuclease [Halobacteriovoraceae bacterium]|nr:restriction endonuclease [Halobacteriovoraceae bacterium]MCB9093927.1 restriction endonuclease [Halobacteriovoraceae bacterium]